MRIKLCMFFLLSLSLLANIPERVSQNIEKNSYTEDKANIYVRDQERAYKRIVTLGKKEGLDKETIDREVKKLEKKYGTNYEIIYKYFYYDVKEIYKEEEKVKEKTKINENMKKEYNAIIIEAKIPDNIKEYIENKGKEKYPNNYSERVNYTKELMEFYYFIKK